MPFETLEFRAAMNMPPKASISYMRSKGRGKNIGRSGSPKLLVTVPTAICAASKAETFTLLLGSGHEAGKLRIKGSSSSNEGVKPSRFKRYLKFNFGYVPRLGSDIFDTDHYPVRDIGPDEFEIDVPASWFADAAT